MVAPKYPPKLIWKAKPSCTDIELKLWLEWAGAKLLALRIRDPAPRGYKSFWPDYPDEISARGYTQETLRAPAVSPEDITIMDEILQLPPLLTNLRFRRVIQLRLLITPVTNRHVYSYERIAGIMASDARYLARSHLKAINELTRLVPPEKASMIRKFLTN